MNKAVLCLLSVSLSAVTSNAQYFLDSHEFERTFNIGYGNLTGTAFVIFHNNKNYWVTAKHLFDQPAGSIQNQKKVNFSISSDSVWTQTSGTLLLHSNPKVDIAIISMADSFKLITRSINPNVNIIMGSEGYFLGYPYGLKMKMENRGFPIPLVKKFVISGVERRDGVEIFYLDGHNNPGFSGGPVYLPNPADEKDKRPYLIAVISAYVLQQNELSTPAGNFNYHENSGIIVAIGKQHILEILKQNGLN